jgi:hypothetical protein
MISQPQRIKKKARTLNSAFMVRASWYPGEGAVKDPFMRRSVQCSGFKVQGTRFRVQGSGFRVQRSAFRSLANAKGFQSAMNLSSLLLFFLAVDLAPCTVYLLSFPSFHYSSFPFFLSFVSLL